MTANIRTIKTSKFIKYLKSKGLKAIREKGDHLMLTRKDLPRPVVIQTKFKEQSILVIKNTLKLIDESVEDFLKEIDNI